MKGAKIPSFVAQASSWTCRSCVQRQKRIRIPQRISQFSTRSPSTKPRRRTIILLAATGVLIGVGTWAFADEAQHAYQAAERTRRVVGALALCINEYVGYISRVHAPADFFVVIASPLRRERHLRMRRKENSYSQIAIRDVQIVLWLCLRRMVVSSSSSDSIW